MSTLEQFGSRSLHQHAAPGLFLGVDDPKNNNTNNENGGGTEDEWRLAIRSLVLQREHCEYHRFRELLDRNKALLAEVTLLRRQLFDNAHHYRGTNNVNNNSSRPGSGYYVVFDDDGETNGNNSNSSNNNGESGDTDTSPASGKTRSRRSSSSSTMTGATVTTPNNAGSGGMQVAKLRQQLKALHGKLSQLQQREVEFTRMKARVLEAEEQMRMKDQLHDQNLLAIKNQQAFIRTQKDQLNRQRENTELLQKQLQMKNKILHKTEAHNNALITENEKVVTRLIQDKAKMQEEMNQMNAVCDALKERLKDYLSPNQDRRSSRSASSLKNPATAKAPTVTEGLSSIIANRRQSIHDTEKLPSRIREPLKLKCGILKDFSMLPDASSLALADSRRGCVAMWTLPTEGQNAKMKLTHMVRLPKARRVDMHENFTLAAADDDSNVYVLPNSKKSTFSKVTMAGHTGTVLCVGKSADGTKAISGATDGVVKLWNLSKPQAPIASFEYTSGERRPACTAVAFSPDGNIVATGYTNHAVVLWDCRAQQQLLATREFHEDLVTSLCFSPGTSQSRLLSAGRDSCLKVIDVRNWQELHALTCSEFTISSPATKAAFSSGGQFAAAGSVTGKVVVWDTYEGTVKKMLTAHRSPATCCYWTANNDLYTSDETGIVMRLT